MTPAESTVMMPLVVVKVTLENSNDGASADDDGPVGAALQAPSMTVSATVAAIRADVFIGRILGSEECQPGPRAALALLFACVVGVSCGQGLDLAASSCDLAAGQSAPVTAGRLAGYDSVG
jgi:hypothetical protein